MKGLFTHNFWSVHLCVPVHTCACTPACMLKGQMKHEGYIADFLCVNLLARGVCVPGMQCVDTKYRTHPDLAPENSELLLLAEQ